MSFCTIRDVPEQLVAGRERKFLSYFYREHAHSPTTIGPSDVDEYLADSSSTMSRLPYPRGLHETVPEAGPA